MRAEVTWRTVPSETNKSALYNTPYFQASLVRVANSVQNAIVRRLLYANAAALPISMNLCYWKVLLARNTGPNLYIINGIGSIAIPMKARRLVAQLMPSLSYICTVNKGKAAPKAYLRSPLAATADAPYWAPYVSSK